MPRALQPFSQNNRITHNPLNMLSGNPIDFIGDNPFGAMTDEIIFGAVDTLLGWIDDATGLDLLGMVTPLQALLGTNTGLLSGLLGWLTPGNTTIGGGVFRPLLNLIPGMGGGAGTIGGLGSFLNPIDLVGSPGVFSPIMSGGLLNNPLFIPKVEDLILGKGDFQPQYPPYTPPYTPSGTSQATQWLELVREFLNWGDFNAPGFTVDTAAQRTIAMLLSQNLLAGLTNGKISNDVLPTELMDMLKQIISLGMPTAQIPTSPTDIITLAIQAWDAWWSIITGAQQQATTAVTQAATNTAAINKQLTGGVSIVDTVFNTVLTPNINPTYITRYFGVGAGTMFADGLGNIEWLPSGGFPRTGYFMPPGTLNTDNFEVQLVLDPTSVIPAPVNVNQCYIWLFARANDALTEFTAVRIGFDTVSLGPFSDNFTPFFTFPITSNPFDSWILRGGYAGTDGQWIFKLFQNNFLIDPNSNGYTYKDPFNLIANATHRRIGGGMTAGTTDSNNQLVPPRITSITGSDRLATAA